MILALCIQQNVTEAAQNSHEVMHSRMKYLKQAVVMALLLLQTQTKPLRYGLEIQPEERSHGKWNLLYAP